MTLPRRALLGACWCAAAAAVLGGCGSSSDGAALAWKKTPSVYRPADLPSDRVLLGTIHNASKATRQMLSSEVVVRDAHGRRLPASAGFTNSYAHGLYGAFQQPSYLPDAELTRLGRLKYLNPGSDSPVFVAWRETEPITHPVTIVVDGVRLKVPDKTITAG